jgi:cell division protein FtsZ
MITMDARDSNGSARIVVFGVGGGGGNAVDNMVAKGDLKGVGFYAANTDRQALERSKADHRLQIGTRLTNGLGAGADPEVGKNAALEDQNKLAEILKGVDMVFVTAGMGGGTGTGAAPVIARAAKEAGALTVGVVTKPFSLEGVKRARHADAGIADLEKNVDSLIVIPNDKLLENASATTTIAEAFGMADDVLYNAVKSISSLVLETGLMNVDFADVRRIMKSRGRALMSTGEGTGEGRTTQAAQAAITSSLLEENSIKGATGILVNFTGGPDFKMQEFSEAMKMIKKEAHESAEIITGIVIRDTMQDRVKLTVIATGFDHSYQPDVTNELKAAAALENLRPQTYWTERAPTPSTSIWTNGGTKATTSTPAPRPPMTPARSSQREPSYKNPFIEADHEREREQPAIIRKTGL